MKAFARRAALVAATVVTTVGLTAVSVPAAQAMDSGWGCGGACKVKP